MARNLCESCSKGALQGQGEAELVKSKPSRATRLTVLAIALCVTLSGATLAADRPTPSGLPVPRYVTLKFDKVNARAGPGVDHRLDWVYQVRGLPVQVVAETSEWRRICGPEGELAWVHRRLTDGRRAVINMQAQSIPLLNRPEIDSPPFAYLRARSLAQLQRCQDGWCRVKADGASGWVRQGSVWGTAETPQCG